VIREYLFYPLFAPAPESARQRKMRAAWQRCSGRKISIELLEQLPRYIFTVYGQSSIDEELFEWSPGFDALASETD